MSKRKSLVAYLLFTVLIFGTVIADYYVAFAAITVTESNKLGGMHHYNGIIFDDLTAHQADIEGAMAVGGEAHLGVTGQYDMGASYNKYNSTVTIGVYENPNGYPTALFNGPVKIGTNQKAGIVNIYGGPVVINGDLENELTLNGLWSGKGIQYATPKIVREFFSDSYKTARRVSSAMNKSNDTAVTATQLKTASNFNNPANFKNKNMDAAGLKVATINVIDKGHVTISEPKLPTGWGDYDVIIYNFPNASSATFTGGSLYAEGKGINTSAPAGAWKDQHALLEKYASKVVWNFPEAGTIQISGCGVVGSVFATEADVFATGGSINGMLIANSFEQTGGMELHAFKFKKNVFDFTAEGDPGSVRVVKRDKDSKMLLQGVEFKLQEKSGSSWADVPLVYDTDSASYMPTNGVGQVLKTDQNGRFTIVGLPQTTYRLVETAPLPGYESCAPVEFTIDEDNGVYEILELQPIENTKKPSPKTNLTVWKWDETYQGLEGAEFVLLRWSRIGDDDSDTYDAVIVDTYTSKSDGAIKLEGLEEGIYYLAEAAAPDGYEVDVDRYILRIKLTYDERTGWDITYHNWSHGNSQAPTWPMDNGNKVGFVNKEHTGNDSTYNVVLLKVDADDSSLPLSGATFRLSKLNETTKEYEAVQTEITDWIGYAYFRDLEEGFYMLEEVDTPDDYVLINNDRWEDGVHYFKLPEALISPLLPDAGEIPFPLGAQVMVPEADTEDILSVPATSAPADDQDTGSTQAEPDNSVANGEQSESNTNSEATADPRPEQDDSSANSAQNAEEPSENEDSDSYSQGGNNNQDGAELGDELTEADFTNESAEATSDTVDVQQDDGDTAYAQQEHTENDIDKSGGDAPDEQYRAQPMRVTNDTFTIRYEEKEDTILYSKVSGTELTLWDPALQEQETGTTEENLEEENLQSREEEQGEQLPEINADPPKAEEKITGDEDEPLNNDGGEPKDPLERVDGNANQENSDADNEQAGNTVAGGVNTDTEKYNGKNSAGNAGLTDSLPEDDGDTTGNAVLQPAGFPGTTPLFIYYHQITCENKRTLGEIVIEKVDSDTKAPLPGAEFQVLQRYFGGTIVIRDNLITDDNGRVVVSDLPFGSYWVVEVKAPAGYKIEGQLHTVVLDENSPNGSQTLELENDPMMVEVEFVKMDGESGKLLPGAEYKLEYYDRAFRQWLAHPNYMLTYRSGTDGTLGPFNLGVGVYKIVETKAPDGYELDKEFGVNETIFSVMPSDESNGTEVIEINTIVLKNYPVGARGQVSVIKADSRNHSRMLSGAVFHLYTYEDDGSGSMNLDDYEYQIYRRNLTTEENGILVIDNLKPGNYALYEVTAPDGYDVSRDIVERITLFKIEQDSNNVNQALEIEPITIVNDPEDPDNPNPDKPGGGGSSSGGSSNPDKYPGDQIKTDTGEVSSTPEQPEDLGTTWLSNGDIPTGWVAGAYNDNPDTGEVAPLVYTLVALWLLATGALIYRMRRMD